MFKMYCNVCKKEIVGEDWSIAELHVANDYGNVETTIHVCDDCVPNVEKLLNIEFPHKRTVFDNITESLKKIVSVLSRNPVDFDNMEANDDEQLSQ